MESHPTYPALAHLIHKYPRSGGALFQTYNDLLLSQSLSAQISEGENAEDKPEAQQWSDLEVLDLQTCDRGAFRGRRPRTETPACVFPCSLAESLSMTLINAAFDELGNPPELFMAITGEDSSIVYYKFSTGIVKPQL